jgi:hypothetical protein
MLVYDPINLENIPLDDYLENDVNNIVIFLNNYEILFIGYDTL